MYSRKNLIVFILDIVLQLLSKINWFGTRIWPDFNAATTMSGEKIVLNLSIHSSKELYCDLSDLDFSIVEKILLITILQIILQLVPKINWF